MQKLTTIPVVALVLAASAAAIPALAQVDALTAGAGELWSTDLTTGQSSLVSTLDQLFYAEATTLSTSGEMLVFAENRLLTIDISSGSVSERGRFSLPLHQLVQGLAEDACGRLFLRVRDLETGTTEVLRLEPESSVAPRVLTLPPGSYALDMAIRGTRIYLPTRRAGLPVILSIDLDSGHTAEHPVAAEGLQTGGHDFDEDGNLWLAARAIPIDPLPPPGPIHELDTATWTVTEHPPLYLHHFAISPPGGQCLAGPLAVPTVSSLGLMALACLLALAGSWFVAGRRRVG